jgi:formate-dependent nitrite reductase cytochrome c552 subunit
MNGWAVVLLAAAPWPLNTPDPAVWGKQYPVQYEMWKRPSREEPQWKEKRGHGFSLKDRDESFALDARLLAGRPVLRPMPAGCLECHASEAVQGATYWEARTKARTPVACIRCHNPKPMCQQCHAEYYVSGGAIKRPDGESAREIEAFYDRTGYRDWTHAATGAAILEPRHPQAQMWKQGHHARSGVTCADCHMPRLKDGITDHQARGFAVEACIRCHQRPADELRARVKLVQDRIAAAESRATEALLDLIDAARGLPEAKLTAARQFQRRAQWRIAFVRADGSGGFHAPHESAELLLEALDFARRGRLQLLTGQAPRPQRSPGPARNGGPSASGGAVRKP